MSKGVSGNRGYFGWVAIHVHSQEGKGTINIISGAENAQKVGGNKSCHCRKEK